jgi:hypothetical protein
MTSAPAVPAGLDGLGGPVLLVTDRSDPFSSYLGEILLAEGLNAWSSVDITELDAVALAGHPVVLLGETELTDAQAATLEAWVEGGGNLIAMRPDRRLSELLGVRPSRLLGVRLSRLPNVRLSRLLEGRPTPAPLSDAYLQVDVGKPPGQGLTPETMQFHGPADLYALDGATAVAQLYSTADMPTDNPAVTLRSVGTKGGQAAAFAFDLARSVVYSRQGNPDWEGQELDGQPPLRSSDLFFRGVDEVGGTSYVDLAKVSIPQADEQQRLLVKLIEQMAADRTPIPRFWYLPDGAKAAVFLSGDDHGGNGTAGRFDQLLAASAPGCDVTRWQCPRMTAYVSTNTSLTSAQAASYAAAGFEISVHVSTGCANWTPDSLSAAVGSQLAAIAARFPDNPLPRSERIHCIVWSDWSSAPSIELLHGLRLDANYYYWPAEWVRDRPGFFTGSALPMRFADRQGHLIDVYQAVTQMTDESGQSYPRTIERLLDGALGPLEHYGVFTANMHTDSARSSGSDAILAAARDRGVPVISGEQLLTWLDGRNGSRFEAITWDGHDLAFTVRAAPGSAGLQAMVPVQTAAGSLISVSRDGVDIPFTTRQVKGSELALLDAGNARYVAHYGPTAPIGQPGS